MIYAVAPSPLLVPMVWVGTDDGLIHVTTNDGKTWQNVTPPALTAWSRVTTVEASHFDWNAAYASVDRHQLQDFEPYIYRTRDMGKTWQKITNGLPAGVYVHVDQGRSDAAGAARSPARSAACSSRSTTATTGSRCSSTCR